METNLEAVVDVDVPEKLLLFYTIHGIFALIFNAFGIFLISKNPRIVRLYRGFLINMQLLSLIADAQNTLLMQPVYIFPIVGGYTNGILWKVFGLSSHVQMAFFLLLLYLLVASIVSAIVTKYQVIASIGNKTSFPKLFWTFVIVYHSFSFLIFGVFCFARLSRQEEENIVRKNYPHLMKVMSLENVEIYDISNIYILATTSLIMTMLASSIIISVFFSIALFRTLRSKRLIISTKNFMSHQIAVTSLIAQAFIPFVVIIIPFGTIMYFFYHMVPRAQDISNFMMAVYSFHSTLSTLVMIISNPQYRQLIRKQFKTRNSTFLTTPPMTKIGPTISYPMVKKLSTPQV